MVTRDATRFRFPRAIVVKAMPAERTTPHRGLPVGPNPFAKGKRKGNIRSPAKDWRIRGAPKNDAIAEDKVAAITPASMRKEKRATFVHGPIITPHNFTGQNACKDKCHPEVDNN